MNKFIIREFIDSDKNFIFSTWLKGVYHSNDWYQEIPSVTFFTNYQIIIENILESPDISIKVACLPDAPDVILGYSVYENSKLHWVFIKESWRKMGIGKALMPERIQSCTHLTKVGKFLKRKYGIIFNPFN